MDKIELFASVVEEMASQQPRAEPRGLSREKMKNIIFVAMLSLALPLKASAIEVIAGFNYGDTSSEVFGKLCKIKSITTITLNDSKIEMKKACQGNVGFKDFKYSTGGEGQNLITKMAFGNMVSRLSDESFNGYGLNIAYNPVLIENGNIFARSLRLSIKASPVAINGVLHQAVFDFSYSCEEAGCYNVLPQRSLKEWPLSNRVRSLLSITNDDMIYGEALHTVKFESLPIQALSHEDKKIQKDYIINTLEKVPERNWKELHKDFAVEKFRDKNNVELNINLIAPNKIITSYSIFPEQQKRFKESLENRVKNKAKSIGSIL